MASQLEIRNSFGGGELAPEFHSRNDLKTFAEGMAVLKNVFILPSGGVTVRPGCEKVADLKTRSTGKRVRLGELVSRRGEKFAVFITEDGILVCDERGQLIKRFSQSMTELGKLQLLRLEGRLLFVHEDYPLKMLSASETQASAYDWQFADWQFGLRQDPETKKGYPTQPFYRFAPADATLETHSTNGTVVVKCSRQYFTPAHVGRWLSYRKGYLKIGGYHNPTSVTATYHKNLGGNVTASTDWAEQAFSDPRGWPKTACLYRGRLCLAGSKSAPNWLWISKAGNYEDFLTSEGLADEAMSFGLAEGPGEKITALAGGQHLKVFTDRGEWIVGGEPFTGENLQLRRYSNVGSAAVPPVQAGASMFFLSRNRSQVREFFYENLQNAYKAKEVSRRASHLVRGVNSMAYCRRRNILFCCMDNGKIAALTAAGEQGTFAASSVETLNGTFVEAASIGDEVYFVVNRYGDLQLERFNDEHLLDHSSLHEVEGERKIVDISRTLRVNGNHGNLYMYMHKNHRRYMAPRNTFSLLFLNGASEIGIPIHAEMVPLPLPDKHLKRMVKVRLRFINTRGLKFAAGGITTNLSPMNRALNPLIYHDNYPPMDGEVSITCAKNSDAAAPTWRIFTEGGDFNFTLLSITMKTEVRQ